MKQDDKMGFIVSQETSMNEKFGFTLRDNPDLDFDEDTIINGNYSFAE